MSAAGKVCTGFSNPYVGKYNFDGTNVTYTEGMKLARGVDVKITPDTRTDNNFYADDVAAETDEGMFTGGTCAMTVDGLHAVAERFVFGLPEPEEYSYGSGKTAKITKFGENRNAPYVGIGFIAKYRSDGVTTYVPVILRKARFQDTGMEHKTEEGSVSWQTQSLSANLFRDDTANADWKWLVEEQSTLSEAVAILEAVLGVNKAVA